MRSVHVDIIRKCSHPVNIESCSAFGGSSTSGTLTSTDSNLSNKEVHSGTLASTDSNNSFINNTTSAIIQAPQFDVGNSNIRALGLSAFPEKHPSPSRSTSSIDLRHISVVERLSKTHPIWYLPEVGRSGAVHLLKDRDIGIFVVRQSSKKDIMALSVQFPNQDGCPNVDHYLIQPTDQGLHLQGSTQLFTDIPCLIAHYCDNREDLPYRLILPPAVRAAKTSQELAALSMLGQNFWTSPKYDSQSRSSSRSNLSDHSTTAMNKSHSEPISIKCATKNVTAYYSQSTAMPQHTPPKQSVIDLKSYLIQKQDTAVTVETIPNSKSFNALPDGVHTKLSAPETMPSLCMDTRPSNQPSLKHVTSFNQAARHVTSCNQSALKHVTSFNQPVLKHVTSCNQPVLKHVTSCNQPALKHVTSCNQPALKHVTSCNQPALKHVTSCNQPALKHVTSCNQPALKHVNSRNSKYFLQEEESGTEHNMVLHVNDKENRVHIEITKRDSRITVPYSNQTNIVEHRNEKDGITSSSLNSFNNPEEYYFRSDLSDKLSDYEDIWKTNYADGKVGSVQADLLQRLQPNLMCNTKLCTNCEKTSDFDVNTMFTDQCLSLKCVTKDLNVSLDKLNALKLSGNKNETCVNVTSELILHTCEGKSLNSKNKSKELNKKDTSTKAKSCTADTLLEENAGCLCDCIDNVPYVFSYSEHSNSCHSDKNGEANNEDSNIQPNIKSVQTQTSPLLKTPSFGSVGARKSASTSSLSTLKNPVYSEPFDALGPENTDGQIQCPKVSNKFRRKSAPALSIANRCHSIAECHRLSPHTCEGNKCNENEKESINESDHENIDDKDLYEMSLEQNQNDSELKLKADNSNSYEKVWVGKETELQSSKSVALIPIPRKANNDKKLTLLQEDFLINHKNPHESAEKEDQKNLQNEHFNSAMNDFLVFDECYNLSCPTLSKFPVDNKQIICNDSKGIYSEGSTAEDIITLCNPELTVKPCFTCTSMSEYDNLNSVCYVAPSFQSVNSAATTIFCNPWENSVLGKIMSIHHPHNPHIISYSPPTGHAPPPLPKIDPLERIKEWQESSQKYQCAHVDMDNGCALTVTSKMNSVNTSSFGEEKCSVYDFGLTLNTYDCQSQSWLTNSLLNEQSTERNSKTTNLLFGADFREKIAPVLANPQCQKPEKNRNPDKAIRDYIIGLSNDQGTTFCCAIENFIQCTLESHDRDPYNITRNIRQFMNGIKNYLVKHGEGELEDLIERERQQVVAAQMQVLHLHLAEADPDMQTSLRNLGNDEILNIDAIIEGALHVCVLQPLKQYIYTTFVNEYTRNGNLKLLSNNIEYARTKTAEEIGIRNELSAPDDATLEAIKNYLNKMQESYSPVKKLEYLLSAMSSIYKCVAAELPGNSSSPAFGADDFLPMLIYILVHCGMVSVEIEADYMWGLLHPSLLSGEGGYYLTSLSSAALVIKKFKEMHETKTSQQEGKMPSISDMQGFLRIGIPNEQLGTIQWKTLPVRPSMMTRDVCAMIAHKFNITNPQEYGLYTLDNGEQHRLMDMECPQVVKAEKLAKNKECIFTYKRNAANIKFSKSVQ